MNSLDKTTVESIVEKCQFVFNIDYILDNFPILSHDLAHNILVIVDEVFGDIQEAVEPLQLQWYEIDSDSLLVQLSDGCTEFTDTADSDDSNSCSEDPIDSWWFFSERSDFIILSCAKRVRSLLTARGLS